MDSENWQMILGVVIGVSLAASCGFRIFVPMLVGSLAMRAGWVDVADSMSWIGSWPAVIMFAIATVVEIAAYYIPWVDHALDVIVTPLSVAAGALTAGAFMIDMDPFMRWSLAIVAGGGAAASVQTVTVGARAVSTVTTGGLANPIVTTVETIIGFFMAVLAVLIPLLAAAILLGVVVLLGRYVIRSRRRAAAMAAEELSTAAVSSSPSERG